MASVCTLPAAKFRRLKSSSGSIGQIASRS